MGRAQPDMPILSLGGRGGVPSLAPCGRLSLLHTHEWRGELLTVGREGGIGGFEEEDGDGEGPVKAAELHRGER